MVTYTPKTDEQLAKEGLLPAGAYDATCIETMDRPSKKGSEMITLKLQVFDPSGDSHKIIFDYIVLGSNYGERKLRHAASAFGLMDVYNGGVLKAEDFQDKSCRIDVKQQDGTADFPMPKNVVGDYLERDADAVVSVKKETKKVSEDLDDSIPF